MSLSNYLEKHCPRCKQGLSSDRFWKNASMKDGLNTYCIPCEKQRRSDTRHLRNDTQRKWWYNKGRYAAQARMYGLTAEQYQEMFEAQEGLCAICGKPEKRITKDGESFLLAVDHDHETGQVRALLCGLCNAGIGHFNDNIQLLERAISYLKEYNTHVSI